MGKFFESWALWQKLTFVSQVYELAPPARPTFLHVLGCAIIVTILLGCAKLFYTHRKLRKHSTIAEQEKTMLATLQRHITQRRRRANSRENDVPFGIRAIESGIEVEGVWISRNNSEASLPIHSRDTSGSSSSWDHVPRKDFNTDVEKQATNANPHRNSTTSNSSTGIAANPRYYSARNSSSDRLPSSRNSRDESPDMNTTTRQSKSRHPPLSYSRYSGNPALIRSGSAASTLSALEAIHHASGPIDPSIADDSFGSSSSNGPSDSAPISASAPGLLTHQAQAEARPRKPSTDLDLMHTHRMSQAAETGQLTPRVRKPSHAGSEWNGGDNNSAASTPRSTTFPDLTDYFAVPSRRRSPSPASSPSAGKSSSEPTTLPPIVRQSSLPDVTPFTKFCQTGPGSQSHSRSSSTSTSTSSRSPSKDVLHPRTLSAPTTTIQPTITPTTAIPSTASAELSNAPVTTTTAAPSNPSSRPSSFEPRPQSAAIVRGHGTGFEILRPGTLPKAQNPPVSLQNARHCREQGSGDWSGSEGGVSGRSSRSSSVEGTGRRKLVKKKGRIGRSVEGSDGNGKEVKVKGAIDDF
ncbi:unnamed protein product [Zymoseptoria tritici ST99CH_1A5]|uniref:Uncharacterized protein n=1 Tax=Zymoseptoria tritici ST99CH_1A5 TaxID=1276529 RepID=A0A1Y6LAI6_ZYMTR|nr:unnamed protein product [Zymoseptoria tritici ST99CH_1A5]